MIRKYKNLIPKVPASCFIFPTAEIIGSVELGEDVIVYPGTVVRAGYGKITIGNNVFIAPNVCLITEEHAMDVEQRLAGLEYAHPVTIGDNVWICTGALILPGVTIGANSVIGAGSVVTKDIPANCLAVGNPCCVIRSLK